MADKAENSDSSTTDFQSPGDIRRNFLKAALVGGGGVLAYSIPAVRAFAQAGATMDRGRAIQIMLPSTYSVQGRRTILELAGAGQRTVSVPFEVDGQVRLTPSGREGVANIEILSMRAVSKAANPLGRGRITASAERAPAGRLDLTTGRVLESEAPIPMTVSYARQPVKQSGQMRFGGNVTVIRNSGDGGGPAARKRCSCLNGNDVSLARVTPAGTMTARGRSELVSTLIS